MISKWTKEAKDTYNEVINYLKRTWTKREIINFNNNLLNIIRQIESNPFIYQSIEGYQNIRKARISKKTSLIYLVEENQIQLIFFRNNYRNPETLEEILKSFKGN